MPGYIATRHTQRYEYLAEMYGKADMSIMDAGCGNGYGATILRSFFKRVLAIDPYLETLIKGMLPTFRYNRLKEGELHLFPHKWEDLNPENYKLYAVDAVEVIEHLHNPNEFLTFASKVGEYLFLTTPLASETGATDNKEHVVEYSHKDLLEMVEKRYNVLDVKYQTSDLRIVDKAEPNGSSLNPDHIVQILWCKRKE